MFFSGKLFSLNMGSQGAQGGPHETIYGPKGGQGAQGGPHYSPLFSPYYSLLPNPGNRARCGVAEGILGHPPEGGFGWFWELFLNNLISGLRSRAETGFFGINFSFWSE